MSFSKRYADAVAKLRVPSGFLLAVSFFWLARPTANSLTLGLPISVCGLAVRAWAAGCLAKNQQLATAGPYGYIRNPLYAGTLLVAAGLVIASLRWELAVIYGLVFWAVYLPVIELEEQHLEKLFPQYAEYRRRTPLLIPLKRNPPVSQNASHFRWELYRRNEEYNALIAWLVAVAWLIWRAR
jgi:protein-S-isoprenylcysteine O-methyltransferase Ste14